MSSECSSPFHAIACAPAAPQDWQPEFEKLLPAILSQARFPLRYLFDEAREEALQEVLATACVAFARLHQQGRADIATASSLARFAVRRYRIGRRMAERTYVDDVSSPACRARRGVRVESCTSENRVWDELLAIDRRRTPAELVASKLDFYAFLETLDYRQRQIAAALATGETTQDTAQVFGLSPGRISQIRQEFKAAWERFVGNVELAAA